MSKEKPQVSLQKCESYEEKVLRNAVIELLKPLGGLQRYVKRGQRVLLKPNLLSPKKTKDAVCTDPSMMLVVGQMAADLGAKVSIGDSPALVSANRVFSSLGVKSELERRGFEIVDFSQVKKLNGKNFRALELSGELLDAEVVINLPKLKTHSMMVLTMAVKNLYGCVVGKRKAAYHLQVRESRERFAQLLIDIAELTKPTLNILDGVVGMEGNGPGSGIPKKMSLIAASESAWALDLALARILDYKVTEVPVLAQYEKLLTESGIELDCSMVGMSATEFKYPDFKRARTYSLVFGIPTWIRRPLNRLVLPYPRVDKNLCIGCGNCAESCPANVIKIENKLANISLPTCIRCFCCQEVCPVRAITVKHPFFSFGSR